MTLIIVLCVCCSTTAPAVDRIRPTPRLTLAQPSATPGGLPPWWELAHREQREADDQAEPAGTSPAAAAEKAATLLRVIVNVRINGREPKVRICPYHRAPMLFAHTLCTADMRDPRKHMHLNA